MVADLTSSDREFRIKFWSPKVLMKNNLTKINSTKFLDSLPVLVFSVTSSCFDRLTSMFPLFVTALNDPDVEPIEMFPFLTFTSVKPEKKTFH